MESIMNISHFVKVNPIIIICYETFWVCYIQEEQRLHFFRPHQCQRDLDWYDLYYGRLWKLENFQYDFRLPANQGMENIEV